MKHSIPYMTKTRTGWNYNPPWKRECKPPKPQTMPKPRVEDSAHTIARLCKIGGNESCQRQIGKRAGEFYLAATDGHRALLLPDNREEREGMPAEFGELPPNTFVTGAWFFLALKRAMCISNEEPWGISLKIDAKSVTMEAEYEGDTFSERLTAIVQGGSGCRLGLNGRYLQDALGVWPLYLHFTDAEHMVVLRPEGDSWRYLLMPLEL